MRQHDFTLQVLLFHNAAFIVPHVVGDNVRDQLAKWTAVLSPKSYDARNDGILVAFGQSCARDNHIMEVLARIGTVLAWLSDFALVDACGDPRRFDDIDPMFKSGVVLWKVDVRGNDVRKTF